MKIQNSGKEANIKQHIGHWWNLNVYVHWEVFFAFKNKKINKACRAKLFFDSVDKETIAKKDKSGSDRVEATTPVFWANQFAYRRHKTIWQLPSSFD